MRVKKVRGMKRKTKDMTRRLEEGTLAFPAALDKGYWHLHLPVAQGFFSPKRG